MKLDGMDDNKRVTCFLVTEPMQVPPVVTDKDWTKCIITSMIPTHVQTCSKLYTTYSQVVSTHWTSKRKRTVTPPCSLSSPSHLQCSLDSQAALLYPQVSAAELQESLQPP